MPPFRVTYDSPAHELQSAEICKCKYIAFAGIYLQFADYLRSFWANGLAQSTFFMHRQCAIKSHISSDYIKVSHFRCALSISACSEHFSMLGAPEEWSSYSQSLLMHCGSVETDTNKFNMLSSDVCEICMKCMQKPFISWFCSLINLSSTILSAIQLTSLL